MSPFEIAVWITGIALALVGGYWALAKLVVAQFNAGLDVRFQALEDSRREGKKVWEDRFGKLEKKQDETEKAVLRILTELPREYVRREDHIRFETAITAKLDALNAYMQLLAERLPKKDA